MMVEVVSSWMFLGWFRLVGLICCQSKVLCVLEGMDVLVLEIFSIIFWSMGVRAIEMVMFLLWGVAVMVWFRRTRISTFVAFVCISVFS